MTAVKKSPAGATRAAPAKKARPSAEGSRPRRGRPPRPPPPGRREEARRPGQEVDGQPASSSEKPARPSSGPKATGQGPPPPRSRPPPRRPHRRRRHPTKAPAAKAPAKKAAAGQEGRRPKRQPPRSAPAKKAARPRRPHPRPPKRPTVGPYAKDTKFLDAQRVLLLEERTIYAGQAVDLRAEADSLALEREPGDVQFDEESGRAAPSPSTVSATWPCPPRPRRPSRRSTTPSQARPQDLRCLRAVLPAHPQGPAPGAALRPAVCRLQERWAVTTLTGETGRGDR